MPVTTAETAQLSEEERRQLEALLAEFDRSWDEQLVGQFAGQLPDAGALRRSALVAMVKLDLEQRWRRGRKLLIDGYLKRFPELSGPGAVPVDLILAEYEVCRRFGAPAEMSEYAKRFPDQVAELQRLVEQIGPDQSHVSAGSRPPVSTLTDQAA